MADHRRSRALRTSGPAPHHVDLPAAEAPGATRIEYHVVRSARRKRTIEVSVRSGAVTVRAPLRTSDEEIRQVVRHRATWILDRCAEAPPPVALETGATVPFRGESLSLVVRHGPSRAAAVQRGLFGLHVAVPHQQEDKRRREAVAQALAAWLRERADELIPPRVEHWAGATGWRPSRVLVRDQRRRWGSCAPDGTLRLSWRLVMLDGDLLDYVAVHELAHLRHPHHGPAFWRAVEAHLPDYRALRRRLREEGRRLPL